MIIDANISTKKSPIACDFLIIGGGLAGLSVCHSLLSKGHSVTILESGSADTENDFAKKLNYGSGSISDHLGQQIAINDYLHESRYRGLGGSGHLWGGKCAELDPIDFISRSWLPHSGWPISYDELKPYFNRACELLQIPHFNTQQKLSDADEHRPLVINNERVLTTATRCFTALSGRDHPIRFQSFINQITQHESARLFLHCTVVEIHADNASKRVQSVKAVNYQHQTFDFIPRYIILAAGGLENARLLLQAKHRETIPADWLSNTLGRYFMGHMMHTAPNAATEDMSFQSQLPANKLQFYFDKTSHQQHGVFQLTRHYQRKNRLRNSLLSFQQHEMSNNKDKLCFKPYFMVEQEPNPQSQIILSESNIEDQFGTPQAELRWQLTHKDLTALTETLKHYQFEFESHQIAHLTVTIELNMILQNIETARHHMGTTRMSASVKDGVVDNQCQVHGIDNLFITGTSVFPSSGVANPTLGIIALSLRLADRLHIREQHIS